MVEKGDQGPHLWALRAHWAGTDGHVEERRSRWRAPRASPTRCRPRPSDPLASPCRLPGPRVSLFLIYKSCKVGAMADRVKDEGSVALGVGGGDGWRLLRLPGPVCHEFFQDGRRRIWGRRGANRRSEVPGGEVGRLQAVEDWPPLQREALELANIFVFINT
jgi:hypothetical protein